jgi:hypothetical protein
VSHRTTQLDLAVGPTNDFGFAPTNGVCRKANWRREFAGRHRRVDRRPKVCRFVQFPCAARTLRVAGKRNHLIECNKPQLGWVCGCEPLICSASLITATLFSKQCAAGNRWAMVMVGLQVFRYLEENNVWEINKIAYFAGIVRS